MEVLRQMVHRKEANILKESGMVTIISIMVHSDLSKNEICIMVQIEPTTMK